MRLLSLGVAAVALCAGQVCAPSPEIKTSIDQIQKLPPAERRDAARVLRDHFPENIFVQSAYLDAIPDRDVRIREFEKALTSHPEDARYLYYRGASLVGASTPGAIRYLDRSLEKDPSIAPAHLRLMEIYASANFKDAGKLESHVSSYLKACPNADLAAYSYLAKIDAPGLVQEGALTLRKALALREEARDLYYYRTIWALEFKASPAAEHEQVRQRIRGDLERLRNAGVKEHAQVASTLREGYKLIKDTQGLKWVDEQTASSTMAEAYRQFNQRQALQKSGPGPGLSREYFEKRNQAWLSASAGWIQLWPQDEWAWTQRFYALRASRAPESEIEEAGSTLLRLAGKSFDPSNVRLVVAGLYLEQNMHPGELEGIVKAALADLDQRKVDPPTDLGPPPPALNSRARILAAKARGLSLLCDVYRKAQKWAQAEEVLAGLRETLDTQKKAGFTEAFDEPAWKVDNARYWEKMADCAEQQGHKLDAMVYYLHECEPDIAADRQSQSLALAARKKALELWTSLGGSDQGWLDWTRLSQGPTWESAAPPLEYGPEAGKSLPDFSITDAAGRPWTLAELKNKVILISIWATWCGPCQGELPQVQKIFDRVKDRRDILVLTLNEDDDPGLIQPFLESHHYTFPVLPARDLVNAMVPGGSIPRNWLVDRSGVLKSAVVGFYLAYGVEWTDRTLKSLEQLTAESIQR